MRTKYCGHIRLLDVGKVVALCGWVHKKRNFGNFIFIDIRDQTGIIQIICNSKNKIVFEHAIKLTPESCIQIIGIVKKRTNKNRNYNMQTGEIEIVIRELNIINTAHPLPLDIESNNDDHIRLKYRYLDLRKLIMKKNLIIRSKITHFIINFMQENNFINIETPILSKSTPGGAKDYLISSRIHKDKYYALSQSPQIYKQLLMVSGFDKYYQIVKCFRNEDLRSDRQPEFTQIDLEVSFANSKKIRSIIELMIQKLWNKIIKYQLDTFPVLSFHDSMEKYGTDKPDLRNPIYFNKINHLIDSSNILLNTSHNNIKVGCIVIPNGISIDSKKINSYNNILNEYKDILYEYIYVRDISSQNKMTKSVHHLSIREIKNIILQLNVHYSDILLIISGKNHVINNFLNKLITQIGKDIDINLKSYWKPVWIINFPMFKKENNCFYSIHHPFTAPKNTTMNELKCNPEKIISDSYDLVINGYEIGGGSVRINNFEVQQIIFDILGMNSKQYQDTFNFFLNAFKYGIPPHAGIALGLDRIVMLLTGSNNIKDVIAFPKTNNASCILTGSPSKIIY